jgi:hypothetical protein
MQNLPLDFYGIMYGTDKSSMGLDYLRHYDAALSPFRERIFNMIEIGVFDGASLKMWKSYFPNARIIGVDIQERCKVYEEDRIVVEIGSQADPDFLTHIANKYPPLVVIDDGSHIADHIITSWETLFRHVQPGGCYIVEDLYMHEGPTAAHNRGKAPMGAQDYVLTYARQLLDGHIHPFHADGIGRELHGSIDRIQAVRGSAIVWKKASDAIKPDYALLELMAERSGLIKSWYLLAAYILKTGGPLDIAENAARRAVAAAPNDFGYLDVLSLVLERSKRLEEALSTAKKAHELAPERFKDKFPHRIAAMEKALASA